MSSDPIGKFLGRRHTHLVSFFCPDGRLDRKRASVVGGGAFIVLLWLFWPRTPGQNGHSAGSQLQAQVQKEKAEAEERKIAAERTLSYWNGMIEAARPLDGILEKHKTTELEEIKKAMAAFAKELEAASDRIGSLRVIDVDPEVLEFGTRIIEGYDRLRPTVQDLSRFIEKLHFPTTRRV